MYSPTLGLDKEVEFKHIKSNMLIENYKGKIRVLEHFQNFSGDYAVDF